MLLQKWVEFFDSASQRQDKNLWVQSPSSYVPTAIRYLIKLDAQGEYQGLVATSSGRRKDRGKYYAAPHVLVTSGPEPKLLVGNCEYVLGRPRDPKKDGKKVLERHKLFIAEVEKCAQETSSPQVKVVLNFLTSETPKTLVFPDDFTSEDLFTFEVEGALLIDDQKVQKHWFRTQKDAYELGGNSGQCIVCGKDCLPGKAHPIQIKGIPGGQTSGMAIVSANKDAFYSYDLRNSLLSPTCWDCAERYAKAYYVLRESEGTHLLVGPLVYLFWSREPASFNIASLFSQPQPEDVKALIASARTGRLFTSLDTEAFYATALTASGGRVVVRDWLETTVGQVKEHLARWFALQNIVDWDGSEGSPYGLFTLTRSLIPQKGDMQRDLPPNVPRVLLKVALQGGTLPSWLMFQAIKRNRAEQAITRPRAALIKMALLSQEKDFQEDAMVQLDEDNHHPSYLCGRLLAVLEQVQFQAVSPKATLIDRFYGTASTAPGSVFPRLIRGAQAHLGKLRKERFGAYAALQGRLEAVMENLAGFPKALTLEEQGWFSLGYYHQRAWDRSQAKARRAAGEAATETEKHSDDPE
jgi:CRISPR-associated protein Csd1